MVRSKRAKNKPDRWIDAEWLEYLEAKALELRYDRRLSLRAIAVELTRDVGRTVTHSQIQRLLLRRRRQSVAQAEQLGRLLLADELAALDEVIAEAWIGWKRSLEPVVETRETLEADGTVTKTSRITRSARPDPRFLEQVRAGYQRIAEVLGLVAPGEGQAGEAIEPEDLREAYESLLRQGLGRGPGALPGQPDGVPQPSPGPTAVVGAAIRDPGESGDS